MRYLITLWLAITDMRVMKLVAALLLIASVLPLCCAYIGHSFNAAWFGFEIGWQLNLCALFIGLTGWIIRRWSKK